MLHKLIKEEEEILKNRFYPSLVAALAVLLVTLVLSRKGFDLVLLTSIASSVVIITNRYTNDLTLLGNAMYSYLAALIIGFVFIAVRDRYGWSLVTLSFVVIFVTTIAIYLFHIFHPPAVGIALGIATFKGDITFLPAIIGTTLLIFLGVKILMYLLYNNMKIGNFMKEFHLWR